MQLPHKYLLLIMKKENNEKTVQISWVFFWRGGEAKPENSNSYQVITIFHDYKKTQVSKPKYQYWV